MLILSLLGWLPVEEWRDITQKELDEYRMVGEKGYQGSETAQMGLR